MYFRCYCSYRKTLQSDTLHPNVNACVAQALKMEKGVREAEGRHCGLPGMSPAGPVSSGAANPRGSLPHFLSRRFPQAPTRTSTAPRSSSDSAGPHGWWLRKIIKDALGGSHAPLPWLKVGHILESQHRGRTLWVRLPGASVQRVDMVQGSSHIMVSCPDSHPQSSQGQTLVFCRKNQRGHWLLSGLEDLGPCQS